MTTVTIDLLDVDQRIFLPTETITAASPGMPDLGSRDWFVSMERLRGGLSDGVDVVTINNGSLELQVLPTRGMGLWKGQCAGVPVMWNSPVERPVHPSFVDPMRRGGIGWLDGFNELICRCGLGWHGAPGTDQIPDENGDVVSEQFLPLHGRIANLPAHRVFATFSDDGDGQLSLTGVVDEAAMFGGRLRLQSTLLTSTNSSQFRIVDVVSNRSGTAAEVEMLYHCNIGEPFLGPGSVFFGSCIEVAPRDAIAAEAVSMWNLFEGPSPGFSEQVYFMSPQPDEQGMGIAVLCNADADLAFCIRFDTTTLPWFTLWKNTQAEQDGYVTGLEPGSSFPNLRTFERRQGRVITLAPGEEVRFELLFDVVIGQRRVRELVDEVTARQTAVSRTVHTAPRADWSS